MKIQQVQAIKMMIMSWNDELGMVEETVYSICWIRILVNNIEGDAKLGGWIIVNKIITVVVVVVVVIIIIIIIII